ncbi:MAG: Smr/MutS family protein [Desulfovibrio sp.]
MGKKKNRMKNLDDLKQFKFPKPKKEDLLPEYLRERIEQKEEIRASEPEVSDEDVFLNAMKGVDSFRSPVAAVRPKPKEAHIPTQKEIEEKNKSSFEKGDVEFEIEKTEDWFYGYVKGMDSLLFNQLRCGTLEHTDRLDLHGMLLSEAEDGVLFFLRECYLQRKEVVILVTGKGTRSQGGMPVLQQEVQNMLTNDPLKKVVLAYASATPEDGGVGAMYVLLRKFKGKGFGEDLFGLGY